MACSTSILIFSQKPVSPLMLCILSKWTCLSGDPTPEIKKSFLDLESKITYSSACCSYMHTLMSTDRCAHLCHQRPGYASKLPALRSHSHAPCHLQPTLLTGGPQPSSLSPSAVLGLSLLICSHILFPTSSLAPSIPFPDSTQ